MKTSNRRSSSLPRAGSARRSQRSSTPSRRQSDLQEKPAWDATANNLDKYKLSAEELERRKASRVSKNRVLSADTKRSFVEAWARNVTASALTDTDPDQDRPRSSPHAGDLPINYGNVVQMLRKSPAAGTGAGRQAASMDNQSVSGAADATGAMGGGPSALAHEDSSTPSLSVGMGTVKPSAHEQQGRSPPHGAVAAMGGPQKQAFNASAAFRIASGSAQAAGTSRREAANTRVELHPTDISITPATLRPRFNPAEATTIISYGGDSDEDAQGTDSSDQRTAAPEREDGAAATAAFEAALFGRPLSGPVARLQPAWDLAASADRFNPDAAADIERRLRSVEAALAGSSSSHSIGADALDDVASMREELRKVRDDNAKLRQELNAFSSHASTLLTQLQAQVQQLLHPGAGGTASGAAPSASAVAGLMPQPYPRQQLGSGMAGPGMSQASGVALGGYNRHAPLVVPTQPQQVARNIFADIDVSVLQPLSQLGGAAAGAGGASSYGFADSRTRQPPGGPAGLGGLADTLSPYAPQPIPVSNLEDGEVPLPSFAAFRRSAGTAAFTSARGGSGLDSLRSPAPGTAADASAAPGAAAPSPPSAPVAVQPRSFPTQYQPRSLGGPLARPAQPHAAATGAGIAAAAASASGAYASALAAGAAAATAARSQAGAAGLERGQPGLPQPLVFSVGPEFRAVRTTGLSADNSMSLSAHTAAAAAARAKSSFQGAR